MVHKTKVLLGTSWAIPWEHDGNTLGIKKNKKYPTHPLLKRKKLDPHECMLNFSLIA